MDITGKTLIEWGYEPGAWFKEAVAAGRLCADEQSARRVIAGLAPPPVVTIPLNNAPATPFFNIEAETEHEQANVDSVRAHMRELMRVPTVVAGAVMPDACPAGSAPGTIPVGGVVATKGAIHPGMHSADICCSMAMTVFDKDADPTKILDAGMALSHFGGGGRAPGAHWKPPAALLHGFESNPFLGGADMLNAAVQHFGTQGDGNHFFYVGRIASTDEVALVTHHGSRKPGAILYKLGMAIAEAYRRKHAPEVAKHNAWIPSESQDGEEYWRALQWIRGWTKANHYAIHDTVRAAASAGVRARFWNEHNFVFRKPDGLFYHGKGATPAFPDYAYDASGLTLIPLNMAEPILITRGLNAGNGLGFAPHGAGRNYSRTQYMRLNDGKTVQEMMAEQTKGLDVRFFSGTPDASELPGAYKNARAVREQIEEYELAEVVDMVHPIGSIMAGDWQVDAPWRRKKAARAQPTTDVA